MAAFGFQPREDPQRLSVALEAPDLRRHLIERRLAVMAERRVAQVMGQARSVDDVGVAAQSSAQLAADLGDLERVGQPVADEVVAARSHHLGLGRQPAPTRRVQHARPIARKVVAVGALVGGILSDPTLAILRRV